MIKLLAAAILLAAVASPAAAKPSGQQEEDRAETVEISLKVYYTGEFVTDYKKNIFLMWSTPKQVIQDHINTVNTGLALAGIRVRFVLLCTEQYSGPTRSDDGKQLAKFERHKGSKTATLATADFAFLLKKLKDHYGLLNMDGSDNMTSLGLLDYKEFGNFFLKLAFPAEGVDSVEEALRKPSGRKGTSADPVAARFLHEANPQVVTTINADAAAYANIGDESNPC